MRKRFLALFVLFAVLLCACGITGDGNFTNACESHCDANCNGECDTCGVSLLTSFDFYCINDLHGKLADGENHPGVDELTTFLEGRKQTDDNAILLSAGDMWQGSSESNLTYGRIITDWMNELGFAAMTLGNHEYDWGEAAIIDNAEAAQFPLLAINIYEYADNTLADYCQPSLLIDQDGIQIGIIGAIGDCYSSISGDKVEDVYFLTGNDLTQLVMDECDRLRAAGADFIVYILHDGYGHSNEGLFSASEMASYYDISLSEGYVDLVFEGHTHQSYLAMDASSIYHLQNRGDNKGGICHVEVEFNTVTGDWVYTEAELIETSDYASMADDPIVQQLLDKYAEQISPSYRVVGYNGANRDSDTIKQTVADLYLQLGQQTWGAEYDIVLGGGFISVRSPYSLPKGDVTYSQLQSLLPFDNDLVLCSIKGSDLLEKFVHTSNRNYYICCDDELSVLDVEADGIYYVVVDTYTSSYAPNRLTVVAEYEKGIYARDLLADYIEKGGYS